MFESNSSKFFREAMALQPDSRSGFEISLLFHHWFMTSRCNQTEAWDENIISIPAIPSWRVESPCASSIILGRSLRSFCFEVWEKPLKSSQMNHLWIKRLCLDKSVKMQSMFFQDRCQTMGGGAGDSGQYPDSHQVFVGNMPHNCTEQDLEEIFGKFGKVTSKENRIGLASRVSQQMKVDVTILEPWIFWAKLHQLHYLK